MKFKFQLITLYICFNFVNLVISGMNNVRKQATITKLPAVKQTIRFKHRPALPPLNSSVDGSFAEDEDELEELHRKLRYHDIKLIYCPRV